MHFRTPLRLALGLRLALNHVSSWWIIDKYKRAPICIAVQLWSYFYLVLVAKCHLLSILRSNTTLQITLFSRECFLTPLWRTIKNKGWAGSGREDRLEKITKWKRIKNLKVPSFCAVFNSSNRADRQKDKSYYRFLSNVKNNDK